MATSWVVICVCLDAAEVFQGLGRTIYHGLDLIKAFFSLHNQMGYGEVIFCEASILVVLGDEPYFSVVLKVAALVFSKHTPQGHSDFGILCA